MSIEVRGAEQFAALSKTLKAAGDKDLQRELGKAVNRAVKPLKEDLKQSARNVLPTRGGLGRQVAASKFTTRRRSSARTAGVRVVGRGPYSLWHLDRGVVRHRGGKQQRIQPGWWTEPTEAAAPDVRAELTAAMDAIAKQIGRK